MKKIFPKIITILISIQIIIVSNVHVYANDTQNSVDITDDPIIIRVGYCEDYAMIKSPKLDGYEGYGFEYLNKISEYMEGNYKFEFVSGSWSQGLKRLESGEIDLLGPANYSDERAETFLFTKEEFAQESAILTSLDPEYITSTSYMKLQNGVVGVVTGDATIKYLNEYLAENDITTTIVETDISDFSYELKSQRFDYFLTGSMQMETDLNIVLNLGSFPVYLMGNENSKDIIDKIDDAIVKLRKNEYMVQEKLYFKYLDWDTSSNIYISNEEYELLQEQDVYNVGVTNIYENSTLKNSFEVAGITVDIIDFISNKADININLVEITPQTPQEELDKLDFYFPLHDYQYNDSVKKSISYMKSPLIIIEKGIYSGKLHGMLGMPSYYGFGHESTKYLVQNQGFEFYDTLDDLIKNFNNDYLSKMILTQTTYKMLYHQLQDIEHTTQTTEYLLGSKIIFADDFSDEKIDVINKVISYISSSDIDNSIIKNMSLISQVEQSNLSRQYMAASFIGLFVLILLLIIYKNIKQKQINEIETHDQLTGLLTQKTFIEKSRELLDNNPTKDYTLLTIDIDNFKYLNEIYGYEIGSNILIHVANCIKKIVGENVLISRVSGDNFILIFENNVSFLKEIPELTKKPSLLYDRICNLIDDAYILTFSIGCYSITDKTADISYMMDSCNIAKRCSKGQVGTSLNVFFEEMREQETIKNNVESNMHMALKNKEFVVYYQPKFDMETQEIIGAEALVRWQTQGKLIPPNDFIPILENNGFIEKLDYYVLNETCKFINKNKEIGVPEISVNLSGITIMKKDLVSNITDIIKKHSINPKNLDLEITESAFVNHFELAVSRIDALRELGFTISMDDFGTGISSLGRLKEINIDVLKLDREFIIQSLEHKKTQIIIKNVITMAKELELKTIAEGIETREQLDFLHQVGCDVGQGYFIARPMSASDFIEILKKDYNI